MYREVWEKFEIQLLIASAVAAALSWGKRTPLDSKRPPTFYSKCQEF